MENSPIEKLYKSDKSLARSDHSKENRGYARVKFSKSDYNSSNADETTDGWKRKPSIKSVKRQSCHKKKVIKKSRKTLGLRERIVASCPIVQNKVPKKLVRPLFQDQGTPEKKGKRPPIPETPDREQYWRTTFPSEEEQRKLGLLKIATSPLFKKH